MGVNRVQLSVQPCLSTLLTYCMVPSLVAAWLDMQFLFVCKQCFYMFANNVPIVCKPTGAVEKILI